MVACVYHISSKISNTFYQNLKLLLGSNGLLRPCVNLFSRTSYDLGVEREVWNVSLIFFLIDWFFYVTPYFDCTIFFFFAYKLFLFISRQITIRLMYSLAHIFLRISLPFPPPHKSIFWPSWNPGYEQDSAMPKCSHLEMGDLWLDSFSNSEKIGHTSKRGLRRGVMRERG